MVERFQEYFGKMTDPRVERTKLYALEEILFVLLCGSICGAESWRDFVMFGQEKLDFLREYFPFLGRYSLQEHFFPGVRRAGARAVSQLLPRLGRFAQTRARRSHRHRWQDLV